MEESERLWNAALADRMKGLRGQPEGCSANDFKALGQFLTQDEGANQALLPGRMEEGNLNQDQINACISQYMNLDGIIVRNLLPQVQLRQQILLIFLCELCGHLRVLGD